MIENETMFYLYRPRPRSLILDMLPREIDDVDMVIMIILVALTSVWSLIFMAIVIGQALKVIGQITDSKIMDFDQVNKVMNVKLMEQRMHFIGKMSRCCHKLINGCQILKNEDSCVFRVFPNKPVHSLVSEVNSFVDPNLNRELPVFLAVPLVTGSSKPAAYTLPFELWVSARDNLNEQYLNTAGGDEDNNPSDDPYASMYWPGQSDSTDGGYEPIDGNR